MPGPVEPAGRDCSCRGAVSQSPARPAHQRGPGSPAQCRQHAPQRCQIDVVANANPDRHQARSRSDPNVTADGSQPTRIFHSDGTDRPQRGGVPPRASARNESRHLRRDQPPLPHLASPTEHQALADTVSSRDVADPRTRLVCLGYNFELLLNTPGPPALPTGDDLDHPIHRHTSSDTLPSALRCEPGKDQAAFPGGILCCKRIAI